MSLNTQIQYDIGREEAIKAFEAIHEQVGDDSALPSLAGFLEAALLAVFAMAPDDEVAELLVKECLEFVKNREEDMTCH